MYPRRISELILRATLITLLISSSGWAQAAAVSCGGLANPFGPFDYMTDKKNLSVVEQHHFTPRVEAVIGGATSVYVGGDLDYTLRVFPNHHRALMSLLRLSEKSRSPQPVGLPYSIECYFERALRFRPQDNLVRMIYARYLFRDQRVAQANQQLEQVVLGAQDDPFALYNVGLLYLENENYEQALVQAHKAYSLGFTQPALREQLQLRGKWQAPQ